MSDDDERPRRPRPPQPGSPQRPGSRQGQPSKPGSSGGRRPPPPPDDDYNDIEWDDEDDPYEKLFKDPSLRGSTTLGDRISTKWVKIGIGVIVPIIILFVVINWARVQLDPPGDPGEEITLELPAGASVSSFGSTLEEQNVIPSALAFRLWVKTHDAPQVQAGEYAFQANSSASQALAVLRAGPKQRTDRLTIPEGFRLAQIAERVGKIPGFSEQKFLDLANGGSVRSDYQPANVKSLEGFLFPDTYLLSARDTELTLLQRMRNLFDDNARALGLDRADNAIGRTPYQALVIASMIEAEAKVPADRGKISQVIQNRLTKNMPLQVDATLLYGLGNTKTSLSKKDLETPGPYNTYLNKGMPPTPIGNPGRSSLQAALAPTPGPWLYYVLTDKNGAHKFATTNDEHNRNIADAKARGVF